MLDGSRLRWKRQDRANQAAASLKLGGRRPTTAKDLFEDEKERVPDEHPRQEIKAFDMRREALWAMPGADEDGGQQPPRPGG